MLAAIWSDPSTTVCTFTDISSAAAETAPALAAVSSALLLICEEVAESSSDAEARLVDDSASWHIVSRRERTAAVNDMEMMSPSDFGCNATVRSPWPRDSQAAAMFWL